MDNRIIDVMRDTKLLNIAKSAASKFQNCMSSEEIHNCIINAVWKALQTYEMSYGCKFSSYLYMGVLMECQAFYKMNIHRKEFPCIRDYSYQTFDYIDMMDEIYTHCQDPDLVYDRYYNNMTVTEIADKTKKSNETIRNKLKKDLQRLKKNLVNSV